MVLRAASVLALVSSALAVAPAASAESLDACAQRVIRDWYAGGRVDKLYPLRCYRAAIRSLPEDVLQYTDAGHDIERALEQARAGRTTAGPARRPADQAQPATSDEAQPTEPAASAPAAGEPAPRRRTPRAAKSPPPREPDRVRVASGPPETAQSPGVPYPVIALGALACVLLGSGLATALARRGR
jgi:hypothetical protein